MDYLDGRKLLAPGSRANLLSNRLVLIAPVSSRSTLKIGPNFGLAAALDADMGLAENQRAYTLIKAVSFDRRSIGYA